MKVFLCSGPARAKRRANNGFAFAAFLVLVSLQAFGDTFWDGTVSYTPPFPITGREESGNSGMPVTGWTYQSKDEAAGFVQITFQIMSMPMIFEEPNEPPAEIATIADLKKYLDSIQPRKTTELNVKTALVKIGGRDAVCARGQLSTGEGPDLSFYRVFALWERNPQWLNSSLFCVTVFAQKKETADKLVESLNTVKIQKKEPVFFQAK